MNDFYYSLIILAILSVSLLFTKKIFKNSSPEQSRKIIHVTIGLTTLTFPYILDSHLTVIALGIIAFLGLFALRNVKCLNKKFGAGLFSVDRNSFGEMFFIAAVVVIFSLYKLLDLNVVHYLIPIATLTFADSTAALVGVEYGKKKISANYEDTKSMEGSFIFFVVAFMCSLIPLQLMTTIGRAEVLIISTFVGMLSAMIEMTSHDGNDNFILPFLTFLIIQYNFDKTADELIHIFYIVTSLVIICMMINKLTKISKLAIVSCLLHGYMTLILGSINWLYIPLLEFAFFAIFPIANEQEKKNELNYRIIEYNIIVGTIFVYIKSVTGLIDICFVSFLVSYCVSLCMNTYTRVHVFYNKSEKISMLYGIAKTLFIIELPYIIFNTNNGVYRWWDWIIVLVATVTSAFIAKYLNKKYDFSIVNMKAAKTYSIVMFTISSIIFIGYLILGGLGCIVLS